MSSIEIQIKAALQAIANQMQQLREAQSYLNAALKSVAGHNDDAMYPTSLTPLFSITSQDSVSLLVDKYLDSLDYGAEFTVGGCHFGGLCGWI